MPAQFKFIVFLIAIMAIFLFCPEKIFAQVVINEIEPYAEWVELYKTQEGEVSLEGCVIYFHNSTSTYQKKEFVPEDKFLEQESFKKIDTNKTWLANDGDTVILDCDWGQNTLSYGQEAMVTKPPTNKSIGRYPDGSNNLFVLDIPTPGNPNSYTQPTPTPAPIPSSTLTPASSPSPTPENLPIPSPSLTPSPKPVKVIGAALLGKTLGESKSTSAGFYPWEATGEAESQEATEASRAKFIPKLFLGLGLVFLVVSGLYLWFTQRVQLK